jgi:hypothetical protein
VAQALLPVQAQINDELIERYDSQSNPSLCLFAPFAVKAFPRYQ